MKRVFASLGISLLWIFSSFDAVADLTPKSPMVRQAVDRAVEYLRQNGPTEGRLGGRALIAMALLKGGLKTDHPFIVQTVADIKQAISSDGAVTFSDPIYTAGLVILFLSELNPEQYRRELIAVGRFLHQTQRKDGSWTYLTSGTPDAYPAGDMSMTQYAVIGLWILHQNGIEVSGEAINRTGRWLTSVQNAEGAYAYQTTVSPDFKQISWNGPRLSMTAAGLASVYVCRDLFGYNQTGPEKEKDSIHEAFTESPDHEAGFASINGFHFTVPKAAFNGVQMKGNAWMERRFFPVSLNTDYFFYYLYALERYAAFKELAENKFHESPPWYDKTATVLLAKQKEDGSWQGNLGAPVDTAYAVLFLTRSTKMTFEKWIPPIRFGGGKLIGGRGLPQLTDEVKIEEGKVVSLNEVGSVEQLMERLEGLEKADDETLNRLAELPASEIEDLLNSNKAKIKKMVGHEQADKRLAAVLLLGKSGDIGNVPSLIYALTDPDDGVAGSAQKALLRLARIPRDEPFPKGEEPENVRKRNQWIERWKTWYRQIDPDVVFEER